MRFQSVQLAILVDVQIGNLDLDLMKFAVFLLVRRDERQVVLIAQLMAHGFVDGGVFGIESGQKVCPPVATDS